jgi:protein-S-isoprenylcysteine O-methyltransferase Ste14
MAESKPTNAVVGFLFLALFFGSLYAVLGRFVPWWWARASITAAVFIGLAILGSRGQS